MEAIIAFCAGMFLGIVIKNNGLYKQLSLHDIYEIRPPSDGIGIEIYSLPEDTEIEEAANVIDFNVKRIERMLKRVGD